MKKVFVNLFLILMCSLHAEIDETKSDVYFANGVNVSNDDADKSLFALRDETYLQNPKTFNSVQSWEVSYNNTDGMFFDMYEAMIQKIYEDGYGVNVKALLWNWEEVVETVDVFGIYTHGVKDVFKQIKKRLPTETVKNYTKSISKKMARNAFLAYSKLGDNKLSEEQMELIFKELFDDMIDKAVDKLETFTEEEVRKSSYKNVTKHVDRYYQSVKDGHGVVIIAHSQGNLFANAAYFDFSDPNQYYNPDRSWVQKYFYMFGVATPSDNVLGLQSPYITFKNDIIQLVPFSLPGNLDNQKSYYYTNIEGEEILNEASIDAHTFLSSYMAGDVSRSYILGYIVDSVAKHKLADSQWNKDKEVGCGCEKKVTLTHKESPDTMDELVEDIKFYGFNADGKVYPLEGGYIKASIGGTTIQNDTKNIETNGGICYTLEGTEEKIEATSSLNKLTKGAVEVSLIWENTSLDLDLKVQWEGKKNEIEDTGCSLEYFVVENETEIYPGRYSVHINLKKPTEPDEPVEDELFPETVYVRIKALSEGMDFKITANSEASLSNIHVADILIEYSPDNKPIITLAEGKPKLEVGGTESIFEYKTRQNIVLSERDMSCDADSVAQSCGCMPCYASIIPYLEQALKGPLSGADVELHIASKYKDNTPLYTGTTTVGTTVTTAGIIEIPKEFTQLLDDEELYLIHVKGGLDIDSNDDYELDSFETFNRGTMHTLILGKDLKKIGYKLNVLTEISYQVIKETLNTSSTQEILEKLDEVAGRLLKDKIYFNSSTPLSYTDTLVWLPTFDKKLLFLDYNTSYMPLVEEFYKDHDLYDKAMDIVYYHSNVPKLKATDLNVSENVDAGYIVGKVELLEEGSSPISYYGLEGSSKFSIDNTGLIRVSTGTSIDYESNQHYKLQVKARNEQGESEEVGVSISINDLIDAPYFEKIYRQESIFTTSEVGSKVIKIDFNKGISNITKIQLSGNGNSYFSSDLNGQITVSSLGLNSLEYSQYFELSATAYNEYGFSLPVKFKINVLMGDIPAVKTTSMFVDENASSKTLLGTIKLANPEASVDEYLLSGEGSDNFTINKLGEVSVSETAVLNYETKTYYGLKILAKNVLGQSEETDFTVYVKDSPDIPVIEKELSFELYENAEEGSLVGNILEYAGLSEITDFYMRSAFEIDDGSFRVDLNGNVYVDANASIDYEQKVQYSFYFLAENSYGRSKEELVVIDIKDALDSPVLTPLVTNIDENSVTGSLVGIISYSLNEGTIVDFSLYGTGAEKFRVDLNGSIYVEEGTLLDFETTNSYNLLARASNEIGQSSEIKVYVGVNNILDAPELYDISLNIDENISNGVFLGNILKDTGLSVVNRFDIKDELGQISAIFGVDLLGNIFIQDNTDIDYEKKDRYLLKARAYNEQGKSLESYINVYVQNILDSPELNNFNANTDENSSIGSIVGSISYKEGLSPVISMRLEPSSLPFSINDSGQLSVKEELDFESVPSYTFFVYATNSQGESLPTSVHIDINDVVDSPVLEYFHALVKEDVLADEDIGVISIKDGLDPITSIKFTGERSEYFTVNKDGKVKVSGVSTLDYEEQREYNFQAQAFSAGYDSNIIDIKIVIDDVDETARAGIGLWGNSNVNIYKLEDNGTQTLIFTEVTSAGGSYEDIGRFDSHRLELEQDKFYLYEVRGGEEYDVDKNGIVDSSVTLNLGTLHAIVKGEWVRQLDAQMSINLMSDVFYQWNKDEFQKSDLISIENNFKTSYNPIANLNGIQALTYDQLTQANQWNYYEFGVNDLEYMASFLYTGNPKYALFVTNSFYYDYYNTFDTKSVFRETSSHLYSVSDYPQDIRIFRIGQDATGPLNSFSNSVRTIAISTDDKWLAVSKISGEEDYQLSLFNISDPLSPVEFGFTDYYAEGMKFSPSSNTLYSRFGNSLDIIDISNKNAPVNTGASITVHGEIKDIAFSSDGLLMYIAASKAGLEIVNINTKEIIGNYTTDGLVNTVRLSKDNTKVIISVNSDTNASIHIININDKTNPTVLQKFIMHDTTFTFIPSTDEIDFYTGNYGVRIYENTNAQYTQFLEQASITRGTDYSIIGDVKAIYLIDNGLKILVITQSQALLFDVSDKNNPVFLEEIKLALPLT